MVNHSIMCRSIKYDYMNILTWTILKKTQILNGCETFAFKYILINSRTFFGTSQEQKASGTSVVGHLPLVLEVPGSIPACCEETFSVRTRFLWCHLQG